MQVKLVPSPDTSRVEVVIQTQQPDQRTRRLMRSAGKYDRKEIMDDIDGKYIGNGANNKSNNPEFGSISDGFIDSIGRVKRVVPPVPKNGMETDLQTIKINCGLNINRKIYKLECKVIFMYCII